MFTIIYACVSVSVAVALSHFLYLYEHMYVSLHPTYPSSVLFVQSILHQYIKTTLGGLSGRNIDYIALVISSHAGFCGASRVRTMMVLVVAKLIYANDHELDGLTEKESMCICMCYVYIYSCIRTTPVHILRVHHS